MWMPVKARGRAVTSLRGTLGDRSALYGVPGLLQTLEVVLLEVVGPEDPE